MREKDELDEFPPGSLVFINDRMGGNIHLIIGWYKKKDVEGIDSNGNLKLYDFDKFVSICNGLIYNEYKQRMISVDELSKPISTRININISK